MIIIVFGLPGSGKSFFATQLAEQINAVYISSDQLRKKMFDTRSYSAKEKQAVYDEMLRQLREAGRQNKSLVMDATFYREKIRNYFIEEANNFGGLVFIEVRADESLVKERLNKPRKDSEADFDVYQKIKAQWEPLMEDHLILQSTDDNINEMLKKAADHLHLPNDKRTNK